MPSSVNPLHLLRPAQTGKQGFSRARLGVFKGMTDALTAIYDRKVDDGTLRPDPAQRAALPLFQPIMDHLAQPAPKAGGLRGLFGRASLRPRRGCTCGAAWGAANPC